MKHTLKITIILITLFLLTQVVGLATINKYIQVEKKDGKIVINHADTIIGPQPEIQEKSYSAIPIIIAVLIGTAFLFLLIRFKLGKLWKLWFFVAVFMTLAVSFNVYIIRTYAIILALILTAIKVFKPNVIIHNLTEIFVYTGITIIILPFLNIISAFTLLILISIYDMYAVWKSKHMIKLAKFQSKAKVFIGLFIPYGKRKNKVALLGGGDLGIPLLFTGVIFLEYGLISLIIPLIVAGSLFFLLSYGKKNKFYPAMPFLGAGCFIGYGIILLLNFI